MCDKPRASLVTTRPLRRSCTPVLLAPLVTTSVLRLRRHSRLTTSASQRRRILLSSVQPHTEPGADVANVGLPPHHRPVRRRLRFAGARGVCPCGVVLVCRGDRGGPEAGGASKRAARAASGKYTRSGGVGQECAP